MTLYISYCAFVSEEKVSFRLISPELCTWPGLLTYAEGHEESQPVMPGPVIFKCYLKDRIANAQRVWPSRSLEMFGTLTTITINAGRTTLMVGDGWLVSDVRKLQPRGRHTSKFKLLLDQMAA